MSEHSTELSTFDFESNAVRTVMIDGEPWFVGKDVCRCLEIADHHQALKRLDEDELRGYTIPTQSDLSGYNTPTQRREMKMVNEPGLYNLIFTSRSEAAKRFKRWLAHEVLPAIRKHGRYELIEPARDSQPVDLVRRGLLDDGRLALNIVREARALYGKSAAKRVWPQLGLPLVEEMQEEEGQTLDPDGVERFAAARLERKLNARTLVTDVYAAYCDWCEERGSRSVSQRWFSRQMSELGIADKGRTNVREGDKTRKVGFFHDIVLKGEGESK